MALTDAERKLLEELEASLTAQDPKLASKFSQPHRRVHPGQAIVGVVGFIFGLIALIAGMSSFWWISVVGFVIMLVSAILVMSAWSSIPSLKRPTSQPPAPSETFMERLEKRWQDRQGQ